MMTSGIALAPGNLLRHSGTGTSPKTGGDCGFSPFATAANDSIEEENSLAKMARLISSNDRLLAEMGSIRRRIDDAKSYLSQPGCRARLGAAYLDRLVLRRSATLALLRANRIEARALLGLLNS